MPVRQRDGLQGRRGIGLIDEHQLTAGQPHGGHLIGQVHQPLPLAIGEPERDDVRAGAVLLRDADQQASRPRRRAARTTSWDIVSRTTGPLTPGIPLTCIDEVTRPAAPNTCTRLASRAPGSVSLMTTGSADRTWIW